MKRSWLWAFGLAVLGLMAGCGGAGGEGAGQGSLGAPDPEFARVPAGQIHVTVLDDASPGAARQATVAVSEPFYLGRLEVTRAQYAAVMGKAPAADEEAEECPECPALLSDVDDFLAHLNAQGTGAYRLPTDAEWFYAALDAGHASNGLGIPPGQTLDDYAWHEGNSGWEPHPVGLKGENDLGLHDMVGNAGELVVSTPLSGAPEGTHELRCVGGSYDSSLDDPTAGPVPSAARVLGDHSISGYFRVIGAMEDHEDRCGLRLVREEPR